MATLPPPPDFLLDSAPNEDESGSQSGSTAANGSAANENRVIPERSSVSVAAAVKTLNEIRHQPASPGVIRRAQSMRATGSTHASDSPVDPRLKHVQQMTPRALLGGTTPKARRHPHEQECPSTARHHTLHPHLNPSLNVKHNSKPADTNHAKTLPKHLPSHPDSVIAILFPSLCSLSTRLH